MRFHFQEAPPCGRGASLKYIIKLSNEVKGFGHDFRKNGVTLKEVRKLQINNTLTIPRGCGLYISVGRALTIFCN
jgi:hypothetical protein